MSSSGDSNKDKLMTETPFSVLKIPASIKKKQNKIIDKYDKNCLKFGISLPAESESTSLPVVFTNTSVILTYKEYYEKLPFLKQKGRTFKHLRNALCNKDKNAKALWCCEIIGETCRILPAKAIIADKASKMIHKVPLSDNRVHFRITDLNRR